MFDNTVSLAVKPPRYGASVFACREVSLTLFLGKCPKPSYGEMRKERFTMDNGNQNAGGLKREVMIRFRVTEAERDLIYEKMRLLHTNNLAAYMRKIAIDGYIIAVDNSDLKAVCAEIQKIGVNFNQIARRVNGTTRIYEQDFNEMKGGIAEIWRLLD
jgi:hypothetical protein